MRRFCILLFALLVFLGTASPSQVQSSSLQAVEGVLNIVWGDPPPELRSGGVVIYTLEGLNRANLPPVLAGHRRVRLRLDGLEGQAVRYFGKRVTVTGQLLAEATPAVSDRAMQVESIHPAAGTASSPAAPTLGTKKMIFLLLRFSDDTEVPHPPSFYTDLANPDTPPPGQMFPTTINGFFKKTSWNQFSWVADVGGAGGVGAPDGWLVLPQPKSFYANCVSGFCADLHAIADDGTAAGRAQGIDFTVYDNISFVLSNDLDCCAYGGGYYSSVDDKSYGVTWMHPRAQEAATYAHELGHSLGLPHSGWVYFPYDSSWDTMSLNIPASSVVCGSYYSRNSSAIRNLNCYEPGDGFIGAHKAYLGWIPAANLVITNPGTAQMVTIEGLSLPLGETAKLLTICLPSSDCTGPSAHYFTVEARVKGLGATSQYDNAITNDGIIIHDFAGDRPTISGPCFFPSVVWAQPIDSTPGDYRVDCGPPDGLSFPNYALYNAQWSPGQTYDSAYGVSIEIVSRAGSAFVVQVRTTAGKRKGQTTSE